MRRPARLCVLALSGALLVSGCALQDPRDSYAYGRADGLWDADYDLLLDWNYPTSANQGRLEAPKRFRPEKPAIGVPWATGNPLLPAPDRSMAPTLEPSPAASVHERDDPTEPATTAHDSAARVDDVRLVVRDERARR